MLKDYLVALSMANLWFIDSWRLFLVRHPSSYPYYHWKLNPTSVLLATMLDVLLLSVILFSLITLIRRARQPRVQTAGGVVLSIVVVFLILNLPLQLVLRPSQILVLRRWEGITTIYSWFIVLVIGASAIAILALIHYLIFNRERLIKIAWPVLEITAPIILVTFSQATLQWLNYRSGEDFENKTAAALTHKTKSHPRILWLVFDEMDFNMGFIQRPNGVSLPEFDRLRSESIFAENAYPPAGDTILSLPALITGRLVSRGERVAPNELMITFDKETQQYAWSTQPNVFSKARKLGFNSALAGWFHPYCRIIGQSLTRCSWQASGAWFVGETAIADLITHNEESSLGNSMVQVAKNLSLPQLYQMLVPIDRGALWKSESIQEFEAIHRQALDMAIDPAMDLILIHYPIPHPPGIFDRSSNSFSTKRDATYADNLVLCDQVLKQLREEMTAAGLWDQTTILVSTDHPLRAERVWKNHTLQLHLHTTADPIVANSIKDKRVPFLLRLSGQTNGNVYSPSFNTVVSADLILALLRQDVTTPESAIRWLNAHRSIAESPYEN